MERSGPYGAEDDIPRQLIAISSIVNTELVLLSLLFALISIAVAFFFGRRRSNFQGNALLLTGPPDSGKTAILSTLVYGQVLPTHASLQANISIVTLPENNKTIHIVDIPGHPRIRNQIQEYLDDAKAIAFVVDASTISRNGPAVAEHLHNILRMLSSLPPSRTLPSLLILAHKTDLLSTSTTTTRETLAINRVKTVLERELEKRRASLSGGFGIEGLGAEGEKSEMGELETTGSAGATFKFADWEGGEITFLGTSSKVEKEGMEKEEGEDGLWALRDWIDNNM